MECFLVRDCTFKAFRKSLKDGIQQRFVCRVWIGVSKYPVRSILPSGCTRQLLIPTSSVYGALEVS